MYLLDTNTLSELRKLGTSRCNPGVAQWAQACKPSQMFTSSICLLEIERGLLLLHRRDPAQASILREWFEGRLIPTLAARVLNITPEIARQAASLHVPDPRPEFDALIAATALDKHLIVVTRNLRDFEPMGVKCMNPWE